MKRTYENPVAEKVAFRYQEQVAASNTEPSDDQCVAVWINEGAFRCETGNKYHQPYGNE